MPRYDLHEDFEEIDVRAPNWDDDRPHSGMGMAALALAALATVFAAGAVIVAIIVDAQQGLAGDDGIVGVCVLGLLLGGCSSVVGLSLGLIGSVQAQRKPLLAVLGMVANTLVLVGMVVLTCLGILSEL